MISAFGASIRHVTTCEASVALEITIGRKGFRAMVPSLSVSPDSHICSPFQYTQIIKFVLVYKALFG